ncbi:hypothetical protein HY768_02735 [candidate division TA06 bacterium]|uniref:Uncharacterized protein n=1 Tax=candidate division TA06 bacterium TaxID=2250710 RepID=A0A933I949_UNCT6|nr:hypothetical protein [candidate division TA06 bacterium]
MYFSEETLKKAWGRAGGKCEGSVLAGGRKEICGKPLFWEKKNTTVEIKYPDGWIALPRLVISGKAPDVPANCEILCQECHRQCQ